MRFRNTHTTATAAVLLCLALGGAAMAKPYHDARHGFTIDVPDDWVQVPDDSVQELSRTVLSAKGQGVAEYVAAFQASRGEWFTYPYVLVQAVHYPVNREPTTSDMREFLKSMTGFDLSKSKDALTPDVRGSLRRPENDPPVLDENSKAFTWRVRINAQGVGPVRGTMFGHFAHTEMVSVNCYAKEDDLAKSKPQFDAIASSFRLDPRAAFQSSSGFWASLPPWMRTGLIGAALGAVGGLLVGLIRVAGKKARQ